MRNNGRKCVYERNSGQLLKDTLFLWLPYEWDHGDVGQKHLNSDRSRGGSEKGAGIQQVRSLFWRNLTV